MRRFLPIVLALCVAAIVANAAEARLFSRCNRPRLLQRHSGGCVGSAGVQQQSSGCPYGCP